MAIFLFGVLVGTLAVAGSRATPVSTSASSVGSVASVGCGRTVTDSERLADLAGRAAVAAAHEDVTSLNALGAELRAVEASLDQTMPGCRR